MLKKIFVKPKTNVKTNGDKTDGDETDEKQPNITDMLDLESEESAKQRGK